MSNNVAKNTVFLMIATLIAKILGFGRELVLASIYGANSYSDAYLVALNIPTVIFAAIGTAIGTTFIPLYFDIKKYHGEKNALNFTNNIFTIVIISCTILAILGIVFAEELVYVFAMGFKGNTLDIAINFTRILIIGVVFIGLSYLITSYLQIKNNFIIPGLISIPYNLIIITSMLLSIQYSPYMMVWGTLLGMISQFIFQIPFAYKYGYKYRFNLNLKDKNLKKMMILILPVFVGVAVNQVNAMIDRTLASTLVEGSISALNYANKLNLFVMAMFIASISVVIYPLLSKLSSEDDKETFINSIALSINSVILLVIPISVGAIVLANPIVRLLFERGAFDSRATNMTAIALMMYSVGMVSFGLRDILGKVFYAIKDTKTPMMNGAIAMGMNIILNIILVRYLETAGLALATSISATICVFLLFNSLKKKIGYFGQDKIIKTTLKSIVSAVVMGVVTYFGYNLISGMLGNGFIYNAISLFGSILLGAIVYGVLVIVLKVEEISLIAISKKMGKKSA